MYKDQSVKNAQRSIRICCKSHTQLRVTVCGFFLMQYLVVQIQTSSSCCVNQEWFISRPPQYSNPIPSCNMFRAFHSTIIR